MRHGFFKVVLEISEVLLALGTQFEQTPNLTAVRFMVTWADHVDLTSSDYRKLFIKSF